MKKLTRSSVIKIITSARKQGNSVNLSKLDLSGIDLQNIDLSNANLKWTNLSRSNLSGADLTKADLRFTNMCYVNLRGSKLVYTRLNEADLASVTAYEADFRGANLQGADLRGADLRKSNLQDVFLQGALLDDCKLGGFLLTPEGSFIGYKKSLEGVIIKLQILKDSQRLNSPGHRKCRASKVKILEFINSRRKLLHSIWDPEFTYKVGQIITVYDFDDDIRKPCAPGIHFFLTREEAEGSL